jgi:hypothetical protein
VPKDTHRTATTDRVQLELPEQVTVAVAELASAAREGLLALAVGTGLQVLQVMLEEDVARLVGARGRRNPDRTAVRHGSEPGQVTLGGRRVRVRRPRVRTADGAGEVAAPTDQAFAATELLGQLAVERMLAKLSTRRDPAGLEPVGSQAEQAATGISSRRCRAGSWPAPSTPWPSCSPRPVHPRPGRAHGDGIRVAEAAGWSPWASRSTAQGPARAGRGLKRGRHRGR